MVSKQKIMIVDDDNNIAELISLYLTKECFECKIVNDGEEALSAFPSFQPNLILLDLMLPGMDGYQVCREIRHKSNVPIIMLTAKGDDMDKILGLEYGADDYITKPFSPIVLSARVRAIEKRCHQRSEGVYQAGELSVNEIRREVCVAGQTVDLTPKEYELLIYFKNNQNIAVSRENILNAVWGYDYFGDLRTVDTHVKKLRAKLGDCGKMIETVRGFGYRFEGEQQ